MASKPQRRTPTPRRPQTARSGRKQPTQSGLAATLGSALTMMRSGKPPAKSGRKGKLFALAGAGASAGAAALMKRRAGQKTGTTSAA